MSPRNDLGASSALALLALILVGMFGLATAPFFWLAPINQEVGGSRELLASLEARLAKQSATGARGIESASLMLQGETADIAGARLQKLINDRVTEAGGRASAFKLLPPQQTGEMTRLILDLSMSIDIDGLRDLLHKIETDAPLIFIDDIAIRTPTSATQDAEPYFLGPFDVSLQVSGFFRADGEH